MAYLVVFWVKKLGYMSKDIVLGSDYSQCHHRQITRSHHQQQLVHSTYHYYHHQPPALSALQVLPTTISISSTAFSGMYLFI